MHGVLRETSVGGHSCHQEWSPMSEALPSGKKNIPLSRPIVGGFACAQLQAFPDGPEGELLLLPEGDNGLLLVGQGVFV